MVGQTYQNLDVTTFPRINRNPKRCLSPLAHFIKKFFEHTIHLWNGIQFISLLHSCLIQRIMDRNGIINMMYDAIMPTLAPGPESITELTVCRCKTVCNTNWCLKMFKKWRNDVYRNGQVLHVESEDLRDHVIEQFT